MVDVGSDHASSPSGVTVIRVPLMSIVIHIAHGTLLEDAGRHKWISEFNEIFSELNLPYRVDEKGGAHPYPDEEFARNRSASIAA